MRQSSFPPIPGKSGAVAAPSYDDIIAADTPIAWWPLSDAAMSATVEDMSGNGWTGTVNGGVTLGNTGVPAGMTGTYASFDGSSGYITTNFNPAGLTELSVECWIQMTGTPAFGARMIGQDVTYMTNTGWSMATGPNTSDQLFIECGNSFAYAFTNGSADIPLTGWVYFAATWDSSTLRTYTNSVLDSNTGNFTLTLAANATAGQILGAWDKGNDSWWSGPLIQIAVYDYALTQTQVTTHYNTGSV